MFCRLGNFVTRFWPILLLGWGAIFLALSDPVASRWGAPQWDDVVHDGEFKYLPETVPSRQGEKLFQEAFSNNMRSSTIVIVVRRENGETGLQDADKEFIRNVLKPRLEAIAEESGGLQDSISNDNEADALPQSSSKKSSVDANSSNETSDPIVARIRTFEDPVVGELLFSEDKKATLIVLELTTEFQEKRNIGLIEKIEDLIDPNGELGTAMNKEERIPPGLDLFLSGSATFGRDMKRAAKISAANTDLWTLILVSVLLLMIYRSPVLMLVPLLTVYVSVFIALHVLVYLADPNSSINVFVSFVLESNSLISRVLIWIGIKAPLIQLFDSAKIYVRVVMYGAGIDYCMFLMARYREELDDGATFDDAIASSIGKVGAAITASAGTVMCGIGMMVFAEFGKFQQAGICMSLSLVFVLCAALTFTPALLKMMGRWAFWPQMRTERIATSSGWVSPTSLMARLFEKHWLRDVWKHVAASLLKKPGAIWLVSVGLMVPFALIGVRFYNHLSYGLISELPNNQPSVIGTAVVQAHFPAGTTGPVTILIENPNVDFGVFPSDNQPVEQTQFDRKHAGPAKRIPNAQFISLRDLDTQEEESPSDASATTSTNENQSAAGYEIVRNLTQWLEDHKQDLDIADIRSVVKPLGITLAAERALENENKRIADLDLDIAGEKNPIKKMRLMAERSGYLKKKEKRTNEFYVSDKGTLKGHVTRIDVVFNDDPFSKDSISRLDLLQEKLQNVLRSEAGPDNATTAGSKLYFLGTTASIRDLKSVTGRDQIRINILVIAGVFMILVILLRRPAISAYLIVSVFFSYLVTLGVTFSVFYLLDPDGFPGLDWKVPMFLFTILIAVGEDYNIFLMTRIEEEQQKHGLIEGITVALQKTGGIISSCGLIMAATFSSLMSGTLDGMIQLGFALAFGVLLDTFVVRPILVPAYLILLHQGRFGTIGKFLGAEDHHFSADGK
ncbi:MAG: MMPL family transporter [Planctomycetes bacterium]|nr:MMPL family transporter [Planctomycetota bacterium]